MEVTDLHIQQYVMD